MRVDYRKLGQIALNPAYRNQPAKDTSDVLANYLYLMSILMQMWMLGLPLKWQ